MTEAAKNPILKTGADILAEYNSQNLEDLFSFVTLEEMISVAVGEAFNQGITAVSHGTSNSEKSSVLPKSNFFLSQEFIQKARAELGVAEGKKPKAKAAIEYILLNHPKKYFHSWDIENALKTGFDVWVTESTITRAFRNLGCLAIKPEKGKRSFLYALPAAVSQSQTKGEF